ncbi:PIG-L family deacetylase [Gordonia jinhuaensis]|uniref:GlcNAc-PI de-N-acetylase n=1 Tax=Gordonia jinhuaensis TaxID=1517702 RepID=A0A916SWT6_9ACTN|nr:PIG-L family deacetylase [Gordonia jinhuaensis]GGB17707.1 GlcNAc-PI de-N-acetylase [Gordonia jinhuaensis]
MSELRDFPTDFSTALVLVAHPDDPEYGPAIAVARWTSEGRRVAYALATSGEAGIEGMSPQEAGPLREDEQRASAAVVGVVEVEFWGFTDSNIHNSPHLRERITETITRIGPELVVTTYGGAQWAPDKPNQRDHMEFAAAVTDAYDAMTSPPRYLFCNGPEATHTLDVTDHYSTAVASLAEHKVYLSVLDPDTSVADQARAQVDSIAPVGDDGRRRVGFQLLRNAAAD